MTPKHTILIVDNNPVVIKLVGKYLENNNHRVLTAQDGLSALDILKKETPTVIIVDLIMPNISGSQLCRVIRDTPSLQDTFIIILSGIAAEGKVRPEEIGANICIAKGPSKQMTKNIAKALTLAEQQKLNKNIKPQLIGFDEIYQREVIKELLASKQETEILLNNMSEGIFELATTEHRIIKANPAALKIIDLPEEKILGRKFISLFDKKQQPHIASLLEKLAKKTHAVSKNNPATLANKKLTLRFLPTKAENNDTALVIVRDVTEQKQTEKALKSAHDNLEKRVNKRTEELSSANTLLSREIAKGQKAAEDLRRRTLELEEANTALKVLLQQSGEAKQDVEEKVLANIKSLVTPFLDELAIKLGGRSEEVYLNIIKDNLDKITSSFTKNISNTFRDLTPREIQVASLIRQGRTNKEMAQLLNLSVRTVEFYRDNLRKKLNIKNKKTNLRSLLLTLPFE
ncbi:MAG: response regulator [Desulfobulbaceae bacterium]|nr:response regulator [Desulfobulbaceae bacterium]